MLLTLLYHNLSLHSFFTLYTLSLSLAPDTGFPIDTLLRRHNGWCDVTDGCKRYAGRRKLVLHPRKGHQVLLHVDDRQLQFLSRGDRGGTEELTVLVWSGGQP